MLCLRNMDINKTASFSEDSQALALLASLNYSTFDAWTYGLAINTEQQVCNMCVCVCV